LLDRHGWPPSLTVWQSIAKSKRFPASKTLWRQYPLLAEH
jgi:hypothetical protein